MFKNPGSIVVPVNTRPDNSSDLDGDTAYTEVAIRLMGEPNLGNRPVTPPPTLPEFDEELQSIEYDDMIV